MVKKEISINPVKAGGQNLCIKKALENRYRVDMHVHSPNFHDQFKEKKLDR